MASQRQVSANRQNGLKGGVKTEEGKAISRLNARKHGIFASALTAEDSEDLYGIEDELVAALRPVGRLEEMVVEKLALTYLRMQRCARAEAQFLVRTWEKPDEARFSYASEEWREERDCEARIVPFREKTFARMVKLIDLYDSRLTNQFLKLTREIERLQRLRADEDSPWPAAAGPATQTDAGNVAQAPATVVCPESVEESEQAPEPPTPPSDADRARANEEAAMKLAYRLRDEEAARVRARALLQVEVAQEDNSQTSI